MWAHEWFAPWLRSVGEDPDRQGLRGTSSRMAAAFTEMVNGYAESPADYLDVIFDEPAAVDPISVEVPFVSLCEHHCLPFVGSVTVTYLPEGGRIVGLSKIPRAIRCLAARLQTQERLTAEIADAFAATVKPKRVRVEIEATHLCLIARGAKAGAKMRTVADRGEP